MMRAVPGVLAKIADHKRMELAGRVSQRAAFERMAEYRLGDRRDFRAALESRQPAIIAEIKKASPSKGLLAPDFDPRRNACDYARGGAACLSVLTDEQFFQGSLADMQAARAECPLPALRKDFTLDEFHVIEAAAHGADAILLIVALLETAELTRFREVAERYRMAAIVEVHDEEELARAVDSGARIIGVNNRDLRDFSVRLETSERLAERIPAGVLRIAESGIHAHADVQRLAASGYGAFLVGEHLMKSGDPAAALSALLGS
ncbi:MAG: indole-3-glycerol phosphate synthase TrpC [Bryobacteraceae bacterium]